MRDGTKDSHILLVEDDETTRLLMSLLLDEAGYRSITVSTGEEALEAARRERPRLVVLDVHLPGLSGYELCRLLRERFGQQLPIIFVSGERIESFDRVAGLLIGADDYLVKPFAPDEFLARVQSLLRRTSTSAAPISGRLTRRELEILHLLADGLSHREIADRLVISHKTVGTHIEHIFTKLGVRNRAQAVARILKGAMPDLEEPSETGPRT